MDRSGPYSQGLLWRIERKGIAPSHLYGTIHLDFPHVTKLPPQVRLVFARSKRLIVETRLDATAYTRYREAMFLPSGGNLRRLLKPSLLARFLKIAGSYGVKAEDAERLKPWAAFILLAHPPPTTGKVLDELLQQMAQLQNKPVYGLETIEEMIAVLEGLPLEDQITVLTDTLCNYQQLRAELNELVALYAERDLAGLMAFNARHHSDEGLFKRFMRRILYDRNLRMVERLEEHLQKGQAFIAVGALHLPGEQGILRLLERRGYKLSVVF